MLSMRCSHGCRCKELHGMEEQGKCSLENGNTRPARWDERRLVGLMPRESAASVL